MTINENHLTTGAAPFDRKSFQESGNRTSSFWDKHLFKMCTQRREQHGSIENHFRRLKIALPVLGAKISLKGVRSDGSNAAR